MRVRPSPLGLARVAIAAAGVVIVDQGTKRIVVDRLGPDAADHRVDVVGRLVGFEYLENSGAAFGVFDGQGPLLSTFAVVVVAVLTGYYLRSGRPSAAFSISLALLAGGAIGNVIDRVRLGYVVDFVAVGVWPKFNVADSAVTVGVCLLAWAMMRDTEGSQRDLLTASREDGPAHDDRHSIRMGKTAQREGG